MNKIDNTISRYTEPDISFVMPCYNEEEIVEYTIRRLIAAFEKAGYSLQLIAVDNGSWDRTGEIIKGLALQNKSVVYKRVEKNEGYGNGILSGIPFCAARWVGIIPADGQVDAEDVVRLYESLIATNGNVLGKVRRRFRMDGLLRKLISVCYNLFVRILWPRLGSIDVNGSPKILSREVIMAMGLQSRKWFLDPEIILKANYMGIRILEFNVFARMRGSGLSHVRVWTCWEFFLNILLFRFSKKWTKSIKKVSVESNAYSLHPDQATPEAPMH
jgi:glycosyltransferase involved in cell wall biosynthesis